MTTKIAEMLKRAGHPLTDAQEVLVAGYVVSMSLHQRTALNDYTMAMGSFSLQPTDINETRCVQTCKHLLQLLAP